MYNIQDHTATSTDKCWTYQSDGERPTRETENFNEEKWRHWYDNVNFNLFYFIQLYTNKYAKEKQMYALWTEKSINLTINYCNCVYWRQMYNDDIK